MSVLIKSMEIPKTCMECKFHWEDERGNFDHWKEYCSFTDEFVGEHQDSKWWVDSEWRGDNCPLVSVPPHGPLIDVNELMLELAKFVRRSNNSDFAPAPTWNNAVSILESAPIIIEAEEGE